METFVVRVWVPAEGEETEEPARMRGSVNHVGSGSSDPFRGIDELLALLRSGIASPARRQEEGGD